MEGWGGGLVPAWVGRDGALMPPHLLLPLEWVLFLPEWIICSAVLPQGPDPPPPDIRSTSGFWKAIQLAPFHLVVQLWSCTWRASYAAPS